MDTNNVKRTIAKNIIALRAEKNMTQAELAEKLYYSDKAVSKWERAESIPDVTVLMEITEIFGVTLDYLVEDGHERAETVEIDNEPPKKLTKKRAIISIMSVLLVWILAAVIFMFDMSKLWMLFIWAVPVSIIVWLVFACIWYPRMWKYVLTSVLMWTLTTALFLTMIITIQKSFWGLFLACIPGQAIIILWSRISAEKRARDKK